MKKLLFMLTLFAACAFGANAQSGQKQMTNPNGLTLDSVQNTTAEGPTLQVKDYQGAFSVSIVLTKISGTIAGTTQLYGSNDGVTYGPLGSAKTNTDVATQTWCFDDAPKKYLYYKVVITPTGTMLASYKAWAYSSKP